MTYKTRHEVFRNLRAPRRFDASEYRRTEPGWVPWVGGFLAGVFFAVMLWAGI